MVAIKINAKSDGTIDLVYGIIDTLKRMIDKGELNQIISVKDEIITVDIQNKKAMKHIKFVYDFNKETGIYDFPEDL